MEYLQPDTNYQKAKAIGVKLERTLISKSTKAKILAAIKKDKSIGALNVPRYFYSGKVSCILC